MAELSPSPDFAPPGGVAYSVSSHTPRDDIRLDQLHHEICVAHGWKSEEVPFLNLMGGAGIEDAVLQIFSFSPIDNAKMAAVARAHKPDENFVHPSPPTAALVEARERATGKKRP